MNLAEAEVNNESARFLIYSPNDLRRPAGHPRMIPCLPPSSSFSRPASLPPSLPSDLPPSAAAAALAMMKGGIEAECSIIPLFPREKRNGEAGREGGKKRNFVRSARDGLAGGRSRESCFQTKVQKWPRLAATADGGDDIRFANREFGVAHVTAHICSLPHVKGT